MMKDTYIKFAVADDAVRLEPIFSLYREFYDMVKNSAQTIEFLKQRLENNECKLIYAEQEEIIIGFVQLYPVFSSTSLQKVYILNDIYVLDSHRKNGIATQLIKKVIELGREENCARISLSTAKDNRAQFLYESIGFTESVFKFYNLKL